MKTRTCRQFGCSAALVILLGCALNTPAPTALAALTPLQVQKLNEYAEATVRYFTSAWANNKGVGFTHAFFGTGKFQVYKDGKWQEEDWDLTRGYGSHVNLNEVTLRFLSLAAAYKMGWLGYLPADKRYAESWGQILTGLQTLRTMQTSGNPRQYYEGHFHRNYLTAITRNGQYDVDRHADEIVCPEGENIQSSDDTALPFMNLLVLERLASDPTVDIPDRVEIVSHGRAIRGAIDLQGFVVGDAIVHAIENGEPSTKVWDRLSAEGAIILAALLLSGQITEERFEQISSSLKNYPVDWDTLDNGVIAIGKPSYHAAMFIHGLRAIHGMPVTDKEFSGLNYFATSTEPVFEAHMDFSRHHSYGALGSQVMTQELYGTPLYEMNGKQVQFPGNENNRLPIPGESLSRAAGPHAWFIPLQRWRYLDQEDIDEVFDWVASYESDFFHSGSDTQLGWEAATPWAPTDRTYAWQASDITWKYTDWGRPYEALNAAYIVLSIFDALNPNAPLASYNVEAERLKRTAFFLDNGRWPSPASTPAVFRIERPTGNVYADGSYFGQGFHSGSADVAEWVPVSESVEPGDVLELDPENPGYYRRARVACSDLVAGVVSSDPGVVLGAEEIAEDEALLALLGIVPVKVCDENGPIKPGDLLTTSSTPGYAMQWNPDAGSPCNLVGKALGPLAKESGIILVLLTAH